MGIINSFDMEIAMENDIKAHRRARLQQLINENGGIRAVFAKRYNLTPQRLTNLLAYDSSQFGDRAARKLEDDLKPLLGEDAAYFFDEGFEGFVKPEPLSAKLRIVEPSSDGGGGGGGDSQEKIGDLGAWVSLFINASDMQKGMMFAAAEAIARKKEVELGLVETV